MDKNEDARKGAKRRDVDIEANDQFYKVFDRSFKCLKLYLIFIIKSPYVLVLDDFDILYRLIILSAITVKFVFRSNSMNETDG